MHPIPISPITLAGVLLLFSSFLFPGDLMASRDFEYLNDCPNSSSTLNINWVEYRVLKVNSSEKTLTLVRSDLWNQTCPSEFLSTTFKTDLFSDTGNVELTLIYECNNAGGTQFNMTPKNNRFVCENRASSFSYFLVGPDPYDPFRGDVHKCGKRVRVPIMASMARELSDNGSLLAEALKMGFNVSYRTMDDPCSIWLDSQACEYYYYSNSYRCMVRAFAIMSIFIIPAILSLAMLCYYKRGKVEHFNVEAFIRNHGSIAPKRYSYATIKKMTNSFTQEIGKGGFGAVFKGTLPDGHLVAVKLLNESKSNGEDFLNEVASIGRTSHVNIVTLLGFCYEKKKRALVYEYMPNGSLDNFIFTKKASNEENRLQRKTLYEIAIGIAKGLEYLHCGCNTRILHFDIKPQNILLDEDFCPKIADFGLAKLLIKKHESIVSMAGARGTMGYIAPEVFSRGYGGVSHKSDVYSFGMLVLEMVGGRNNFDYAASHTSEIYYPNRMYKDLEIESDHEASILINMTESEKEISKKMISISFWCIQTNPADRPSMSKVVEMLEGNFQSIEIPPKPYLFSPTRSP
ncbi:LEAF RUST 10 DISEASE-RESISTANCE LOCUS RECEPTOR-LIKE PROTEIN KINASE-like 2.1 isoform X2 [Humulus lupulus]|uniref:LEAF RUST 10 DISEASE-RESISTANCE LOCUS RECEPTOR-LIKE PROTEIN KINASE-like 2.1 isoform X2 n=1 Tax=Humulus lupulus TaxID=3486 RepID=UPI002B412BDE|nr:LEAF RUST 10 DISEASE-RESISTANCE LOCUS RECEPTOR-LIKE PROTEIN KINASE-like 2.1 isoform X2 [Humulus lupulus]